MIQIDHKTSDALKQRLDILYVLAVEGEELDDKVAALCPGIPTAVEHADFTGKALQLRLFYTKEKSRIRRVALVGVGRREKLSAEAIRSAMSVVWENMRDLKVGEAGLVFNHVKLSEGVDVAATAIAEGVGLSAYKFTKHKTKENPKQKGHRIRPDRKRGRPTLTIFNRKKTLNDVIRQAAMTAEACNITRALSDEPGNIATPTFLAERAIELGRDYGFKVSVMSEDDMLLEGMGSLMAVAQGSVQPAQLIIMEHKPKVSAKELKKMEKVCLVGKGLTFDAGGISIKPADKMWEMKYDKCGGTAVIGAMCGIAALDLPIHVYGVVPASENMPDGCAVKPGDIVESLTGHTIEILNTDAEGRLILADALGYCHRLKPDLVVDMATLTGACVVSLASVRAGLMSNNDELCKEIYAAGERTGEKVWRLPQDPEYGDMLKSEHADIKNIGGRWGGAITAGYFLSTFVPPEAKWAHLDIAGPAWKSDKSGKKYVRKGATGFGTRLCIDFLRHRTGV